MNPLTDRPAIPRQLAREVLVESGHRCAIPACRQTPVELAHIIPWAQVRNHAFDNLIALCPTCHTRYDQGEIDRKSMLQYKINLSILNGRYGDYEKRILQHFAENPARKYLSIPRDFSLLVMYLVRDGLLRMEKPLGSSRTACYITPKGKKFIERWLNAKDID